MILRIFSYAYWPSICLFWRNIYLCLLPTFFLFVYFTVSVPISFYSLCIPKEKKGKWKGSANMLQMGKEVPGTAKSAIKQTLPRWGHQGPRGYVSCSSGMRRDEGKNIWIHAFLPSLPINSRFHKKSSKHGVTFLHLLLNNLVATLT